MLHSIDLKNIYLRQLFPINLIDFGQNWILSASHYNRSEAVQTGNKCWTYIFTIEGMVKIKQKF